MPERGPHFQGGPNRNAMDMARTVAALRDEGGLPAEASLVLSQLLLNLVGHAGRANGLQLIAAFLDAADVRWTELEGGAARMKPGELPDGQCTKTNAAGARCLRFDDHDRFSAMKGCQFPERSGNCICGSSHFGPSAFQLLRQHSDEAAAAEARKK